MSAGAPEDVTRSLQRWTALALGEDLLGRPWSVERTPEQVPDIQRPFALLGELAPLTPITWRTTVPQGDVQWNTTVTINAYPETDGTPRDSSARASAVLGRLKACAAYGIILDPVSPDPTVPRFSFPMEIPLFDYDGVPATGQDRAGPDLPYTGMDINSLSGRCLPDVADDKRYMVVLDLRLSFWAAGAVYADGEAGHGVLTTAVPGTFIP